MNPERFARVKNLVLQVADLSEAERRAALDAACSGDADLRREVESLLAHQEGETEVLKSRAVVETEIGRAPGPAIEIGRRIGHYTITEFRGEGGMGEVYKAEDTRLKRSVALKFVRRDLFASERLKARFVEEARAAAALEHPNICTVHAIEEWEGQLFLVMAFVEGETLWDRITHGPIDLSEILSIAVQVATGIEAAHAKGIVHRDIKSANIMFTGDRRALIVDFGLARSEMRPKETDGGGMMGTVAYMSPEQSWGRALDARTDIWSFGVVLYEMITGRLPFGGENERAILRALREDEPQPCRALRSNTPPELERIVAKALAKKADDRYASATELLADLQALRRRVDPLRRRQQRRQRATMIAAGALVASLATILVRGIILRAENPPLPHATPLQVTSGDVREGEPVLSPDGTRIAYASDETGTSQVYLIGVHGANPRQLTNDTPASYSPAWFPDGRSLAFVAETSVKGDIWRMTAPGAPAGESSAEPILPILLVPHAVDPAISPDGERIAFARSGVQPVERIYVASVADPSDSVMLTQGGIAARGDRNPTWSPDGRSICYEGSGALWIVPANGGVPRRLSGYQFDADPCWAPDGRDIYFSSFGEGTLAIWRVGAGGGRLQRLTMGAGPESHPSISRDGATLAYTTGMTGRSLLVLDRSTGREMQVPNVRNSIMGAISPDGRFLVYQATRTGSQTDFWVQPLLNGRPSGDPAPLMSQPGIPSHPMFSPDGRWVAYYIIGEDGGRDIWVTPFPRGMPARFTEGPSTQNEQPAWSPDGTLLAYVSVSGDRRLIWVAPIAEGKSAGAPRQVTKGDVSAYHPTWSPDGKEIAFVGIRGGEQEVWLVRSDGVKPPYRISSGATAMVVRWDPGTNDLLVSGRWGGKTMVLRRVSLDTGETFETSPKVDFGSGKSAGMFDVSEDGRWLVYPRDEEDRGDVWVLQASGGTY